MLGISAPAHAVVTTVSNESGSATVGLQPRNEVSPLEFNGPLVATFNNPAGNPVVHANDTYAIYWDPTDQYHGDWQGVIDGFLHNLGAQSGDLASVFAVDGQYSDKANGHASYASTFRGAYTDTEPYPTLGDCIDPSPLGAGDAITCLTDQQIQQQLASFITAHNLPKGMSSIFYVLTPPGVTVCLDAGGPTGHCSDARPKPSASYTNSFCSYHSDISPTNPISGDTNTVLYAVIPWTAGGNGDYHLLPEDRTQAYDCQDGGYDPSSNPIEQREKPKEKTAKEEEEIAKLTLEERRKIHEKELREGPHEQEPNQIGLGPDGSYDTGLADLIVNQIAVEQQNTVTDPLLNAWQDTSHNEASDECRNFFAPIVEGSVTAGEMTDAGTLSNQVLGNSKYYLNAAFNLAALKLPYPGVPCMTGINLVPRFTTPNTVNAGDVVGFDGMESNLTLNSGVLFTGAGVEQPAYATYTCDFGDGSPLVSGYAPGAPPANSPATSPCASPWSAPCAASAFHVYQYGGVYEVKLIVTDISGNSASSIQPLTVVGPPPPGAASSGAGGASAVTGAPGSGSSLSAGTSGGPIPGPVARAAAVSRSLDQVLRRGLAVSYSVNEQVAGELEVLLDKRTARHLKITGPTALGLPKGAPAELVIGRAIVVTTTGGHSALRIKFSKSAITHLRGVHRLTLTLRLVVRNAASANPQSTTVVSTVVLHR
jgi:hypothetical protein